MITHQEVSSGLVFLSPLSVRTRKPTFSFDVQASEGISGSK